MRNIENQEKTAKTESLDTTTLINGKPKTRTSPLRGGRSIHDQTGSETLNRKIESDTGRIGTIDDWKWIS